MKNKSFANEMKVAMNSMLGGPGVAEEFLSSNSTSRRFVIGKNDQSAEIIQKFRIDALIDDFDKTNNGWGGVPVILMADLPSDAIVVNCSTSISPVAVSKRLASAGVRKIVSIAQLLHMGAGTINLPWFVRQQRADFEKYEHDYDWLYGLMADEESRQTLLDTIRYRLTANEIYMYDYRVRLKEQYFADFFVLHEEVFVDAGGYDGDTTEELCLRCFDYRKVFLFEPSLKNMAKAKKRLRNFKNIEFRDIGLSDVSGTLHFDADAGSASSVSDGSGDLIEVTTLDSAVKEPVTFIKMDLEGWELKALIGASEHIKIHKPRLAIAVYHDAKDFREIAKYVLSLRSDYKVYLRHYTEGWSESVMFFI